VTDDEITITLRITEEQGYELLSRLARDEEFRHEVEQDPAGVLARYGIEVSPPDAIPPSAQLASKESIAALLESMREGDDPFGRVSHRVWRFHLMDKVLSFGALPMIGRDGAP
jgi:putative modified peptide